MRAFVGEQRLTFVRVQRRQGSRSELKAPPKVCMPGSDMTVITVTPPARTADAPTRKPWFHCSLVVAIT